MTGVDLLIRLGFLGLLCFFSLKWVLRLRRNYSEQNARIQAQLQRETAFSSLGYKLSSATTPKEAAKVIAETAQELLGWHAYALRLLDDDLNKVDSVLDIDTINGERLEVATSRIEVSPMIRKVLSEGPQLILRQDAKEGAEGFVPFGDTGRRSSSLMYVPIRNGSKSLGVLSIQSYDRNAYDEADVDVLQKLADHCGGAMERIRTQELLRQAHDELEERVKDRTLELLQSNTRLHEEIEERKRTEAAVAYEQHLLRSLMDSSPDYIYFKDAGGRFTRVNNAFANQFGNCDPTQMLGKTDFDYIDQNAARESFEDEQKIIQTGRMILGKEEHEFWLNGHEWWCLTSKMPFRDEAGKIVGTFGVTRDITARKKAEEELQRRERMLRNLFENSGDAIFVEDLNGIVLDVNLAGCRLHELEREAIVGKHVAQLVPPDKRDQVDIDFPKLAKGEIAEVEGLSYRADGHSVPVSIRAARIDYEGKPALLLHVRDITRRKHVEEALQKAHAEMEGRVQERTAELSLANERLRMEIAERKEAEALNAAFSNLGFWLSQARTRDEAAQIIMDVADQLLGWDAAYLQLYTSDHQKVIPVLCTDTINGKRVTSRDYLKDDTLTARDKKLIAEGAELILRVAEADQASDLSAFGDRNRHSLSLMYVPIRNGAKVIGALSIQSYAFNSYTKEGLSILQTLADFGFGTLERIEAEDRLRKSERRFSQAFLSSPVPMTLSALKDGRYLDVNDSMVHLMGFRREEMVGHTSLELGIWPEPEDRKRMVEAVIQNQGVRDMSFDFKTKSGKLRKVLLSVQPMDFGGESTILVTIYDVTDRLNLEEQLRHSQKMEAVGQLAAGVAHDFNNILTIIQGHTSMLLSVPEIDVVTADSLTQMSMATERAANLTKQLLTFSRKQVMQPKALDLNEVVGTTSKMLQRLLGESISLHFNYSPNLPTIFADSGMIEQILINLAVNARDAMVKGGKLIITTDSIRVDASYMAQNPEARTGQFICLTVTDTGTGIDAVTLDRIFEPFFTTKEVGKGTGLGLATVYGIVKQHHGWVQVRSELQVGTTFKIFLPTTTKGTPLTEETLPAPKTAGGKETILVVEDEPALRNLVRGILQLYGYRVLEACHGKDALVVWSKHKEEICLLLTDMVMPEGMSGLELAEHLRNENPNLKVVYTSGYSLDLFSQKQKITEGVNFIAKPYKPPMLAKTVRDCLDANV